MLLPFMQRLLYKSYSNFFLAILHPEPPLVQIYYSYKSRIQASASFWQLNCKIVQLGICRVKVLKLMVILNLKGKLAFTFNFFLCWIFNWSNVPMYFLRKKGMKILSLDQNIYCFDETAMISFSITVSTPLRCHSWLISVFLTTIKNIRNAPDWFTCAGSLTYPKVWK